MMEITTLFGSEKCTSIAKCLHKESTCSPTIYAQNLSHICESLRQSQLTLRTTADTEFKVGNVVYGLNTAQSVDHSIDFQLLEYAEQLTSSIFKGSSSHTLNFAPTVAYDLLEKCLDLNPFTRITASQACNILF